MHGVEHLFEVQEECSSAMSLVHVCVDIVQKSPETCLSLPTISKARLARQEKIDDL